MDMYADALQYEPILDRLWQVEGPPGECWLWPGPAPDRTPIAFRKVEGRSLGLRVRILVLMQQGTRPAGHVVQDTCGEALCVNPQHLVWVSKKEVFRHRVGSAVCAAGHTKVPGERCHTCNRLGTAERREWVRAAAATLGMTGMAYRGKYGEGKYRAMGFCE